MFKGHRHVNQTCPHISHLTKLSVCTAGICSTLNEEIIGFSGEWNVGLFEMRLRLIFMKRLQAKFQVILHAKMTISGVQRYPWSLYLINNVEDIVGFPGLRFFNVEHSYVCFPALEMRKSLYFVAKPQLKLNSFLNYKHRYINTWLD